MMEAQHIFVGTYTKKEGHVDGKAKGIYRLSFPNQKPDGTTSKWTLTDFESINPSFITISPNKKYLYAVNELNPNDGDSGTVSSYSIDGKTKDLQFLGSQKTHNYAPCHITVDATNQLAFVSNYVGGVVCVYPIMKNGALGEASQVITLEGKSVTPRQEGSHPHSVNISPDNEFLFIADLGTDKIMSYQIDFENKKLLPTEQASVKVQEGAGPRHFTFHPNGKYAYVVNELDATVNVFDYDNGKLTEKQSLSTLPTDFKGDSWCADIHVHPNGKFLYASNRGHDSIVIYEIDESNGMLKTIGHESTQGGYPRNFMVEPSGKHLWVANQNSDNIVKFEINQQTGQLKKVDKVEILTPVCLQFF